MAGVSRRFRSFRMTAIHGSGWNLKELRRKGKFGQRTKRHLSTPPISMFKQLVPRFRTRVGRTSQKNFLFAPVTSELDGETRGEVYRLSRSGRGGGSERRSPKLYQLVPLILCHWFNQHDRRDWSVPQSQPKKEINPLWHVHGFKGTLIRWTNQCDRGLLISFFSFLLYFYFYL